MNKTAFLPYINGLMLILITEERVKDLQIANSMASEWSAWEEIREEHKDMLLTDARLWHKRHCGYMCAICHTGWLILYIGEQQMLWRAESLGKMKRKYGSRAQNRCGEKKGRKANTSQHVGGYKPRSSVKQTHNNILCLLNETIYFKSTKTHHKKGN